MVALVFAWAHFCTLRQRLGREHHRPATSRLGNSALGSERVERAVNIIIDRIIKLGIVILKIPAIILKIK